MKTVKKGMIMKTIKKMQNYGYNNPNFLNSLSNLPYVLKESEEINNEF